MKENRIVFFDGQYIEADKPLISPINPSTYYGLNVFEGVRSYYNYETDTHYIFCLHDHILRLNKSAIIFGSNIKVISEEIIKIIKKLLFLNKYKTDTYIRITLMNSNFDESWSSISSPKILIDIKPKESKRLSNLILPISLYITSIRRIDEKTLSPKIKCGANYINSRYSLIEAKKNNYTNSLMLDKNGYISESTGSTIFFRKNNTFFTPSLNSSILDSITRRRIIEIIKNNKNKIIQTKIHSNKIKEFDEAFLAGTMIEIQPVNRINNISYTSEINKDIFNSFFTKTIFSPKWSTKVKI